MPKAAETVQQIMDSLQVLKTEIQLAVEEAVLEERARITTQNEIRVAAMVAQGDHNNRINVFAAAKSERERCVEIARTFRWDGSPYAEAAPVIGEAIAKILEESEAPEKTD